MESLKGEVVLKEYSDSEIIECLRKRQSYVVGYLSDRYLPMIRLMVKELGGSSEDARDLFQEGLIIILEKLDSREFILTCKFRTLLYCICENLWKSILRKQVSAANYFATRIEADGEKDPAEIMDNKMYAEIFKKAFKSIDPVGKAILKLYWKDMSHQEIADKLGYTNGYVRKKKCQAQAELTEKVRRHPDYRRIIESGNVLKKVIY